MFKKRKNKVHPHESRKFRPLNTQDAHSYITNYLTTSKYTYANFIFLNLFLQFQKVSNLYFLTISILQFIPQVSTVTPTSWIPLTVVVIANMVKELIEFINRSRLDKQVNNTLTTRVDEHGELKPHRWRDLRVSDVVVLKDDELLPADIIVIATSDASTGYAYIETANLDGETNLKNKQSIEDTQGFLLDWAPSSGKIPESVLSKICSMNVETEPPNDNLHSFVGSLKVGESKIGVTNNEVIYRGCTLRNTKWVCGIVIFTGTETKLAKNAVDTKAKSTTLDNAANRYLIVIFICLILLCIVCGILSGQCWKQDLNKPQGVSWYLKPGFDSEKYSSTGAQTALNIITYLILMSALIPISLTVSMEMVRLGHAFFINNDSLMCYVDAEDGKVTPAKARTSNLSEDLGRIEYIFSDKTGTLTQNVMEFMKCSIAGVSYGWGTTEIGRAAALREGRTVQEKTRPAHFVTSRGDNFYDDRISEGAWMKAQSKAEIERFYTHLAVCHTVMAKSKSGKAVEGEWNEKDVSYQASSPDELALVMGAKGSGFCFRRRNFKDVTIAVNGVEKVYELLNVNEFNSTRKRMSCVVKTPEGKYLLMVKGADSVIYERVTSSYDPTLKAALKEQLQGYANEGLRTLVLAERGLTEAEYLEWDKIFSDAFTASVERDAKLEAAAERIERDLEIVGATAIEDKLQDGVPKCIKMLADANIQLWVLTGDKVETAINIALACNLIDMTMYLVKISLDDPPQASSVEEKKAIDNQRREQVLRELEAALARDSSEYGGKQVGLVIDGYSLQYALEEEFSTKSLGLLVKFSERCKSVVCCRVSPKQKAQVVEIVREKKKVITLAIGDGANDVGMIMKAHIGVGISGKEGVAAVMASDYAIGQFRYLHQLVLVHGRWNFQRIAVLMKFSFYKNIAYAVPVVWFGIFTRFSGVKLWDDYYQSIWNVVFTAVPVLMIALFDKDVTCQSTLRAFPRLYSGVQSGVAFSKWRFSWWMVDSLWCSLVCYFVPWLIYTESFVSEKGHTSHKWNFVYCSQLAIAVGVNLRLACVTRTWNGLTAFLTTLSTIIVWFFSIAYTSLRLSTDLYHEFFTSFVEGGFWLALFMSWVLICAPCAVYHLFHVLWNPSEIRRIRILERKLLKSSGADYLKDADWEKWIEDNPNYGKKEVEVQGVKIEPDNKVIWGPSQSTVFHGSSGMQSEFLGYSFSQQRGGDPEVLTSHSDTKRSRNGRSPHDPGTPPPAVGGQLSRSSNAQATPSTVGAGVERPWEVLDALSMQSGLRDSKSS